MNIKADIFPAIAIFSPIGALVNLADLSFTNIPEGAKKVDRIRVLVMNSVITVASDSPEGIKIVFREAVAQYIKDDRTHRVRTVAGKDIVFTKDSNCGCGSRLKSWNPYGKILYS